MTKISVSKFLASFIGVIALPLGSALAGQAACTEAEQNARDQAYCIKATEGSTITDAEAKCESVLKKLNDNLRSEEVGADYSAICD